METETKPTFASFKRRLTPGTMVRIEAPHGTRETTVQKVQTNAVAFQHPDPENPNGSWHWWQKAGEYTIDGDSIIWHHKSGDLMTITILPS